MQLVTSFWLLRTKGSIMIRTMKGGCWEFLPQHPPDAWATQLGALTGIGGLSEKIISGQGGLFTAQPGSPHQCWQFTAWDQEVETELYDKSGLRTFPLALMVFWGFLLSFELIANIWNLENPTLNMSISGFWEVGRSGHTGPTFPQGSHQFSSGRRWPPQSVNALPHLSLSLTPGGLIARPDSCCVTDRLQSVSPESKPKDSKEPQPWVSHGDNMDSPSRKGSWLCSSPSSIIYQWGDRGPRREGSLQGHTKCGTNKRQSPGLPTIAPCSLPLWLSNFLSLSARLFRENSLLAPSFFLSQLELW